MCARLPSRIPSLLNCYPTRHSRKLCRCEQRWRSIRFYSHLLTRCRIFLQLLYKLVRNSVHCCVFHRSLNLKRWFIPVTHCTTTTKESACRIIYRLRQQPLPKRWFANANMTSFYDVANSVYLVAMTTIRCCSILEFGRGAYNQAVAPHITRPLHATGH